jgi:hypothetical protein
VLEILTGTGLAAAAGLNAWMPLFVLGLADRLLPAVQLPAAWSWLSSDLALWITGILLVVEMIADKVPAVDSVNDIIQTVIRPAAGGVVFGAGAGAQTVRVDDPASLFADAGWVPIVVGVLIALVVHVVKAAARPVANVATAGVAAPVVSSVEDVAAFALTALAIFFPVLVVVALVGLVVGAVALIRRGRRRRSAASTTPA